MKKYKLIMVLCIIVLMSFVGCSNENKENNEVVENIERTPVKEFVIGDTKIIEYEDSTLYMSKDGEVITPDIVVGTKFFDTQIADFNLNFNNYVGKTVCIEGMSLKNADNDFTFVGRYSTSNLCSDCPTGFSYFSYEWNLGKGFAPASLGDQQQWVKVIGTFTQGDGYYYIDAISVEVCDEWGQATVND